jgi:hypothetical protein
VIQGPSHVTSVVSDLDMLCTQKLEESRGSGQTMMRLTWQLRNRRSGSSIS